MIVATVYLTASLGFSRDGFMHRVDFDEMEVAKAEYDRIAGMLTNRIEKKNDLPTMLEVVGINKITLPLDSVCSVSLENLAWSNEQRAGMHDKFPNLRPKG